MLMQSAPLRQKPLTRSGSAIDGDVQEIPGSGSSNPGTLVEKSDLCERHHLSHDIAAVIDLLPLPDCNRHAFSLVAGRHHGLFVPAFALGAAPENLVPDQ